MDILKDTIIDSIKILPFLLVIFLFIELIEHKLSNKSLKVIEKNTKFGPLIGSLLGIIPQCGFSVASTNLYITRIITLGTLISIYLSTSDEMLPILISRNAPINLIIKILLIKVIFGIVYGYIIDYILRNNRKKPRVHILCEEENCNCDDENIFISALTHTIKVFIYIFIISLLLNIVMDKVGESVLKSILMTNNIFSIFASSLVGLIPNCATSILLTELYLNNALSFSALISGLLANSGMGILILFRYNPNRKENLYILAILYILSIISGLILYIF